MTLAAAHDIAWAVTLCTIERLVAMSEGRGQGRQGHGGTTIILAATPDGAGPAIVERLGAITSHDRITIVDQGPGDLGARLDHVWHLAGLNRPVCFFGTDSPDVPSAALDQIPDALQTHDLGVGPTFDGGYWCLAAAKYRPQVLQRIDWGTARVYDQTRQRALESGLSLAELPAWHDVDHPNDVIALRSRLRAAGAAESGGGRTSEEPLNRLLSVLDRVLGAGEPARERS